MKFVLVMLSLTLLAFFLFAKFEVQITTFLHTTSPGTLVVMGLVAAMLLFEFIKTKPKKKSD